MTDRILSMALNGTVLGTITLLSAATLACVHWGALKLLDGDASAGATLLTAGVLLAFVAGGMIRYRNELADR